MIAKQTDLCTCGHSKAAHFEFKSQECSVGDCICACFDKVDPIREAAPQLLEALKVAESSLASMYRILHRLAPRECPATDETAQPLILIRAAISKATVQS